jgi:hypothetical protein
MSELPSVCLPLTGCLLSVGLGHSSQNTPTRQSQALVRKTESSRIWRAWMAGGEPVS